MKAVVVGAGPAGVRAVEAFVQAGVRPVWVEEGERGGGQIYRRPPEGFTRPAEKLYGTDAAKARALHAAIDRLREQADWRPRTLAWHVTTTATQWPADAGGAGGAGELHVLSGEPHDTSCEPHDASGVGATPVVLPFDALVLATGATDRVWPVPGWHQAGCYTLGAAQIALKAQGCAIGARTVLLGTGPLLYLVATQYLAAGAGVAAVLDTAPATWAARMAALPGLLARPEVAQRGLGFIRAIRRAGVPLLQGVQPLRIGPGAQSVTVRDAAGAERSFECDAVALGWHLRAEWPLADLAGCRFRFDEATRQWLPELDADGRSSVRGVYLAGDGARLLGADAAEPAGRLAALAAMADAGHPAGRAAHAAQHAVLRGALARHERFRVGLARAFPWPHEAAAAVPDDTVVCRCEAITAGELRRVVHEAGSREINRAKAFSRVGMGRCQGRYCAHAGAEIVAAAAGVPVAEVGRLRTQAPVKPLPMSTREVDDGGAA